MGQRTDSGTQLLALIALICAITAGILEYYSHKNSVEWLSYNDAFERAVATKKMVYVDFYADWCAPCKQMDQTTFANEKVIAVLKNNYFAARVNVDDPVFGKPLMNRNNIQAMPTSMLFTADKLEVNRFVGYMNPQDFIVWLKEKE